MHVREIFLYGVFYLVLGSVLLLRIVPILPLYFDAEQRVVVQKVVSDLAEQEGWLLSGISLVDVSDDRLTITYRSYIRGKDPMMCYQVSLQNSTLSPCVP